MIATLTPNPCIDKTISVPRFDMEKINRARILRSDVGGKGLNVSLALRGLQCDTIALGFDFTGEHGSPLKSTMAARGIPSSFIEVPGQLRTCTKIFDESRRNTIEVNEYGPSVTEEAGEQLLELMARTAADCDFITFSGSLPGGLGSDFYFRCAEAVRNEAPNCKVVVDAEGELLLKALDAQPFLIKPNIHEFQATFGVRVSNLEELDAAVLKIIRQYSLGMVCVSMGGDGAYIATEEQAYFCPALKVEVRSIQGAGDSMVAGICAALQLGLPLPEVLHYGVAASSASISREGTQLCTEEIFRPLLAQDVEIRCLRG